MDIPALRYANTLNGVTELLMMKADVLNGFESIQICTGYKLKNGETTDMLPYSLEEIDSPIYEELPGWNCSLDGVSDYDSFPPELKKYVEFIEDKTGVPISVVSIGPDRTETIYRDLVVS